MTIENHKPKMAPSPDAPPGLEQDNKGRPIPFEKRTEDDKEKVVETIAAGLHGSHTGNVKNPEHEAENLAPMPQADQQGRTRHIKPIDEPEGQQGSTRPGKDH